MTTMNGDVRDEIEFGNVTEVQFESRNRRNRSRPKVLTTRLEYMMQAVYGIVVSAIVYLIGASLVLGVVSIFESYRYGYLPDFGEAVVSILFVIGAIGIGAIVVGIFGVVATLFVSFLNWSLGNIFTVRESIIITGGFVGYWSLAGVFLAIPDKEVIEMFWVIMLWLHLGPVLACVVGSVGTAIWEIKKTRKGFVLFFDDRAVFQFGMQQMLIGTAWAALVLGLSRAFQTNMFAFLVGTWIFWQSVVVYIDARVQNRKNKKATADIRWESKVKEGLPENLEVQWPKTN